MSKFRVLLSLVALLLMSANAPAAYVTVSVPNFSFEMPGTAKQKCWDGEVAGYVDVPGWVSDLPAADSGVESDWPGRTDGVWSGYLMGTDPSVWNLLPYVIKAGDQFALSVDARDNWTSDPALPAKLQMNLYYHDLGGNRVTIATQTVTLTTTWTKYTLTASAGSVPASVGRKLGIGLKNASNATDTNNSWIGLDNVRVPEPTTIALLGLGGLALVRGRKKS